MTDIPAETTFVDWPQLTAFLPRVERVSLQRTSWTLGGSDLVGEMFADPLLDEFIAELYASGAVFAFDWAAWAAESPLATGDPTLIARSDLAELRRLLTAHARRDRFAEGHLGEMIECGQIAAIRRRVAELTARPSA